MNKQDFNDWKRHPVTQQVFSQLQERVAYYKDVLAQNAGKDSYEDAKHSGAVQAYLDLLNIEFEESHGD